MDTDFPIGKVFVAGCHDTKNRDACFFSFEFKGLGKGCHEEQEEDRRHVVPLTDSYTLWDLFDLIFNLQHAGVIVIDLLDGICKFRGGAISAYDIDQQLVICGIICFDEVDKANIRC